MKKSRKEKILNTASWRTFLDVEKNPRVENFLKESGYDVLNQTISNISRALELGWVEIALLVHPNSSSVMLIKDYQYEEVLDFCYQYCIDNEYYELCSFVIKTKNKFINNAKQQSGEKTS
jgi:hypothetical protein